MPILAPQPPPFQTPVYGKTGKMVGEWQRFFLNVQTAVAQIVQLISSSGGPDQTSGIMFGLTALHQAPPSVILATSPSFGPFTQGSVIFGGPSGQLAQDNAKFFWDDTTFRLGLSTSAPAFDLHIKSSTLGVGGTALRVENTNTGATAIALLDLVTGGTNVMRCQVPAPGAADPSLIFGDVSAPARNLNFITGGGAKWQIQAAGHWVPLTDNVYDLGASGTGARAIYGAALQIKAASGNPLTNKNIYLTGTINQSSPVSFYMDTALTGLTGAASGVFLTPSFSLSGNTTDCNVLTIPAPVVTLNGFTTTNASTVRIEGAPTNGTNKRAIWILGGLSEFDGLIALGGNSSSFPALKNSGAQLQARLADDSGFANVGVGLVTTYNAIATVSNGVPAEYATIDTTGLTANVGATTLYSVPASGAGLYRVSAYVVETTAGSISSTLPNVQIVYTDKDTAGSVTIDATPILAGAGLGQTGALTANTIGTVASGVIVLNVAASTTIQYQTVNYASNAAGMAYALHLKLEAL